MMDAVVSHFLPFSPSHAPKACLVAGSKHYSDVCELSKRDLLQNRHRLSNEGKISEAGHFPAQAQLSDTLVVRLCLGGI